MAKGKEERASGSFMLDRRPLIMGIVNVTPDSFSDGGEYAEAEKAIAQGKKLLAEGADILDIGGESTRPGATSVDPDTEARRVLPVIEALAKEGAKVSIDTRHVSVMRAAMAAGASIWNDVTALSGDPQSLQEASSSQALIILMHMQGEPQSMQADPTYRDVVEDVLEYFKRRIDICLTAGIAKEKICLDPGIGFGKNLEHNVELLRHLHRFRELGFPLLLGTSRKSFIAKISAGEGPRERLGGSIASILAVLKDVDIVRVHDVAPTRQALAVWRAIRLDDNRPDR